jgi:hypothetical protein
MCVLNMIKKNVYRYICQIAYMEVGIYIILIKKE